MKRTSQSLICARNATSQPRALACLQSIESRRRLLWAPFLFGAVYELVSRMAPACRACLPAATAAPDLNPHHACIATLYGACLPVCLPTAPDSTTAPYTSSDRTTAPVLPRRRYRLPTIDINRASHSTQPQPRAISFHPIMRKLVNSVSPQHRLLSAIIGDVGVTSQAIDNKGATAGDYTTPRQRQAARG